MKGIFKKVKNLSINELNEEEKALPQESFKFNFSLSSSSSIMNTNNNDEITDTTEKKKRKKKRTKKKVKSGLEDGQNGGGESSEEEDPISTRVAEACILEDEVEEAAVVAVATVDMEMPVPASTVAIECIEEITTIQPPQEESATTTTSSSGNNTKKKKKKKANNTPSGSCNGSGGGAVIEGRSSAPLVPSPAIITEQGKSSNSKNSKKSNKKNKVSTNDVDDDILFLEQAIAQVKEEKKEIRAKKKAEKMKNILTANVVSTNHHHKKPVDPHAPRFMSPNDPELDPNLRIQAKFGKGKNLVAIGPPKVRDRNWLQSITPADSNAGAAVPSSSSALSSSAPADTSLHSSPFSFGFSFQS